MTSKRDERIWTIGGLGGEPGDWEVTSSRTLSEAQFTELQGKCSFIIQLTSQRDFNRLADIVNRWQATVAAAEKELADKGALSEGLRTAVTLDLSAVAVALHRLDEGLNERARHAAANPQSSLLRTFEEVRHHLRAKASYLLLNSLADERPTGAWSSSFQKASFGSRE